MKKQPQNLTRFPDFLNWRTFDILQLKSEELPIITTNQKIEYANIPCSFDIETSSFYQHGEKHATMYVWCFGFFDYIVTGRTWEEFETLIKMLQVKLELNDKRRLIIYVHNLAYEFQFICKRFEWDNVFCIDSRKPVYAVTGGVEFRCSYILSNKGLDSLGKSLTYQNVKKLTGTVDYSLIRCSQTPLTQCDYDYVINDVLVVNCYIWELIQQNKGKITNIPLTSTGFARKYCRNQCLYGGVNDNRESAVRNNYRKYRQLMNELTLTVDEYKLLKQAFQGGFTHANACYVNKLIENVDSFDFTSSYPAVMVCEQFPMSKGEEVKITSAEQFKKYLNKYCCLFEIELTNVEATTIIEHPISAGRCQTCQGAVIDNGRVVTAKKLVMTITEQDFMIYKRFYRWEKIKIGTFYRYVKGYLPKQFVNAILKLYEDKTQLKDVEGMEVEYMLSKALLNSLYGMCVTDIAKDTHTFNGVDWVVEEVNLEKCIEKYNKSKNRFLFYPWGVWVTAYARRNLFTGIWQCGSDYIYSDTDSVKIRNIQAHRDYFNAYNDAIISKMKTAMLFHGFPVSRFSPKTIEDVEKPLGVWDFDGHYDYFKTLGAKRYLVHTSKGFKITVAGVNKKHAVEYLERVGCDLKGVFNAFHDELTIPAEFAGKNTHTYIDNNIEGVITDYLGNECKYFETSAVHLEATSYEMSLSDEFINYFTEVQSYNEN